MHMGTKAGVATLISEKIDFKTMTETSDKEGHYIMIEWLIQQENTIILNIYAPNIGVPKYTSQILIDQK